MQAKVDQSEQPNHNLGSQNQIMALAQTQSPIACTCCQVFREMVHTKDTNCEKLEIHGRVGFITHALHYKNMAPSPRDLQCEMIDFYNKENTEVKQFLEEYCQTKLTEGYSISKDLFSDFYEALSVGLDWKEDNFADEMEQGAPFAAQTGQEAPRLPLAAQGNRIAQRNRVETLILSDLRDYFHLPLDQAAEQLKLSGTTLRRICRRENLAEWPFVKVNNLLIQILVLRRKSAESTDEATRATIEAQISGLEQQIIQQCGGNVPTALNFNDV